MSIYDLVICNGTIVDGTGCSFRRRCRHCRGRIDPSRRHRCWRRQRRDRRDRPLVTPALSTSILLGRPNYVGRNLSLRCSHGVTTIVTGNCGAGFALVAPSVGSSRPTNGGCRRTSPVSPSLKVCLGTGPPIPITSMLRQAAVVDDAASQHHHGPLRVWVMGDRAVGRPRRYK